VWLGVAAYWTALVIFRLATFDIYLPR